MRYIVIIYYVLIEGEQVFETLNVNKNIEANSPGGSHRHCLQSI